jgi:hypothetical protein
MFYYTWYIQITFCPDLYVTYKYYLYVILYVKYHYQV